MSKRPGGYGPGPGAWAKYVCPSGAWTIYDVAEHLGLSPGWTRKLIRRHGIPTGRLVRRVRLAPGKIRTRRLVVLTPTAVRELTLHRFGYHGRASREALTRNA
jgi:hypothetical protein